MLRNKIFYLEGSCYVTNLPIEGLRLLLNSQRMQDFLQVPLTQSARPLLNADAVIERNTKRTEQDVNLQLRHV